MEQKDPLLHRHPLDRPLSSSAKEITSFTESLVWKDMEDFMKDRLQFVRDDLEDAPSHEVVISLQAEARTIRAFLELPNILLQELEKQNEANDG